MCVKIGESRLEERRGALIWVMGQNLVKAGAQVNVGNPCVENADKSQDLNLRSHLASSHFVVSKCCFFLPVSFLCHVYRFLSAKALAPIPLKRASPKTPWCELSASGSALNTGIITHYNFPLCAVLLENMIYGS